MTSDEHQARLYARSRSTDPRERITAAREWVEDSIDNDDLLAAAVDSLRTLETEERPYLGKFIAELIYELLTDAEADFWYRFWGHAGTYPT